MVASTSNSLNPNQGWKYHVFLNFRGKDTRNNFTDHLFCALIRRGFITFRDDKELKRGEVISQELLKAIEESLSAVVILSENYASSTWCLDELLKILESRKLLNRKVLPVFYGVDPSTVRHQKGSFETAFKIHEERFREEKRKVQRWRNALKKVAELSGQDSKNMLESEIIENIVAEVWIKLLTVLPTFNNGMVGIDSRMEYMYSLLRIGLEDVRFIGIWGMGGIGKTTVAEFVFKKICGQFDIKCFLANVRELAGQRGHGLIHLQRELLSRLNISHMRIEALELGKDIIRNLLCNKKVLLVLDDVSAISQLEALAGNREWFGLGSRVIVTTRDSHILTSHGIHVQYKIDVLNEGQSLQLFCQQAFKRDQPPGHHFLELSNCVVQYSGGLPLALKVIGSFLCGRDSSVWEDALNMLKQDPQNGIWNILKVSYDGLLDMEKMIFLHIACFLKGKLKSEVTEVLKNCGLHAKYGIDSLIEKSLVTCDDAGYLEMHDLLEEMGKNIVVQESPSDASKRSRLWSIEDIDRVFRNTMGNESILALDLNFPWRFEARWSPEVFSRMHNLQLLIVSSYCHLPLDLNCLSTRLRVLIWRYCPLKALPLGVPLEELVHLEMQYSKIQLLWNGTQLFARLVFLDLSYSDNLITTPNFDGIPNLEKLHLRSCKNLIEVDPSIRVHRKLIEVNLNWCGNLSNLPRKLEMGSLTQLNLEGCSNVTKLPEFGENMDSLEFLTLECTSIAELPPSFGYLTSMKTLNLHHCKRLICIPNSFGYLKSLTELRISSCPRFCKLADLNENEALECVDVGETCLIWKASNIQYLDLTPSISGLCLLRFLDLSECNLSDESFPKDLGCLTFLEFLDLSDNKFVDLPSRCISKLLNLRELVLDNCRSLRSFPKLPPNVECVRAFNCISMEPSPDQYQQQIMGLLEATVDSKGWGDAKKAGPLSFEDVFCVPGTEIPQWFHRTSSEELSPNGESMIVDIPDFCHQSQCWAIAVCLVLEYMDHQPDIENDLYCYSEDIGSALIRLMIPPLQFSHLMIFYCRPGCWQYDQIKLPLKFYTEPSVFSTNEEECGRREIKKCGYLVFCEEDNQVWRCRMQDFLSIDDENRFGGIDANSSDAETDNPARKRTKLS